MVLAHDLQEGQKTKDIQISQDVTFDTMLFSSNTLEGLKRSGFIRPSPIQLHGIPLGKCGFDLLLEAKSGTGKTAVFTVIALEKIDLDKGLQAVILAPTREIAFQICDVFRQIGCQYNGLRVEVVMGGLPVQEDIDKFNGNKVHIVVGSPGRLKHLISDRHMDISAVRLIVFDEADKLMHKSFLADIKSIYLALPREKQVIMSSATYPETCKEFIKEFVHDAQHICPNSDCVLLGVVQKVTKVKYNSNSVTQTKNRFKELLKIITTKEFKQCLIFCNYRARVREVYKLLLRQQWPAEQLYGAQDQIDRLDALKTLQEYKCRILISTDLAARGIDASNVDLVINFEPPFEWETYLHRIGRAGRFGSYGMAISILSEGNEYKKFMNLLSAVNLSDNVSPLWTEAESKNDGAKIEVSKAEDHLPLIDSNDYSYSELWNLICDTENSPDKEIIEDFHELVNSFQNTTNNSNIESFSDLYDSFQNNHLPDTKEFQYKCIKWPKLSTKQSLVEISNKLKHTVPDMNDSVHNLSNLNKSEESNCVVGISNKSKHTVPELIDSAHNLSNFINGNEKSICANEQIKSNNRLESNSQRNNRYSVPIYDNNSISYNKRSKIAENRFEKNKPIETYTNIKKSSSSNSNECFKIGNEKPKSKCKTQRKERNTPINQIRKHSSSSSSDEDFKIENEKPYSKFKTQRKERNAPINQIRKHTSSSSSNEDFKIEKEKPNSKCKTQAKIRNRSSDQNYGQHSSNYSSTARTHSEQYPTKKNGNSLKNWYKELQIRIRQIEFAVYIDELSKM